MGIEFDLFIVRGSKLTSFPCAGRKLLGLNVIYGSNLTMFLCAGRKLLVSSVGID